MVFSDTSSRLIQFKILSNIVSVYIYCPGGIYDLQQQKQKELLLETAGVKVFQDMTQVNSAFLQHYNFFKIGIHSMQG